jgi:hypothetical protein
MTALGHAARPRLWRRGGATSFVDKRLFVPAQDDPRLGGHNSNLDHAGRSFGLSMEETNMRRFTWVAAAAVTAAIALPALGKQQAALAATKKPPPHIGNVHCAAKPAGCPFTTRPTCAKWYAPAKCCIRWQCTSVIH